MSQESAEFKAEKLLENPETLGIHGVARILEKLIKQIAYKIENGRFRDLKKIEAKIRMIRALAYVSKTYVQVIEAQKIEELEKKLEILEKRLEK